MVIDDDDVFPPLLGPLSLSAEVDPTLPKGGILE